MTPEFRFHSLTLAVGKLVPKRNPSEYWKKLLKAWWNLWTNMHFSLKVNYQKLKWASLQPTNVTDLTCVWPNHQNQHPPIFYHLWSSLLCWLYSTSEVHVSAATAVLPMHMPLTSPPPHTYTHTHKHTHKHCNECIRGNIIAVYLRPARVQRRSHSNWFILMCVER